MSVAQQACDIVLSQIRAVFDTMESYCAAMLWPRCSTNPLRRIWQHDVAAQRLLPAQPLAKALRDLFELHIARTKPQG